MQCILEEEEGKEWIFKLIKYLKSISVEFNRISITKEKITMMQTFRKHHSKINYQPPLLL